MIFYLFTLFFEALNAAAAHSYTNISYNEINVGSVISNINPLCLIKIVYSSIDSKNLQASNLLIPIQIKHLSPEFTDRLNNVTFLTTTFNNTKLLSHICFFNLYYLKDVFDERHRTRDYQKLTTASLSTLNSIFANATDIKNGYKFHVTIL